MQDIDGELTQEEYDKLRFELERLRMEETLGIDHSDRIKELEEKLKGL